MADDITATSEAPSPPTNRQLLVACAGMLQDISAEGAGPRQHRPHAAGSLPAAELRRFGAKSDKKICL
jgi:hypothetical protein